MDDAQNQLTDKLKTANNILVTVSRNPSVDQLSALLGLTLLLNKQGKHAAAVFSGEVPAAIGFLKPEETIEKDTNSLRDFIIALDKNKADKLRYKVEDNVVRIFITPYKTSISETDFEFSQGDFNVDLVVGLGVGQQEDLDEAIVAHGRILHDATVASINTSSTGGLGTINWHVPQASSLSEMVAELSRGLGDNLLDEQIATALLTGVVAETDRFRNAKTTAQTMNISGLLMAAGANQQLVASQLEQPFEQDGGETPGSIEIEHDKAEEPAEAEQTSEPALELPAPEIVPEEAEKEESTSVSNGPKLVTEPPTLGGTLTANATPEALEPSTDPLSQNGPQNIDTTGTLTDLEASVDSPHIEQEQEEHLDTARDEVARALNGNPVSPPPIQALNAQPLGDNLRSSEPVSDAPIPDTVTFSEPINQPAQPVDQPSDQPGPGPAAFAPEPAHTFDPIPPVAQPITPPPAEPIAPTQPEPQAQVIDPNAPPPVPPPIPFQFGNTPQN